LWKRGADQPLRKSSLNSSQLDLFNERSGIISKSRTLNYRRTVKNITSRYKLPITI
jgi:hypothetical protein